VTIIRSRRPDGHFTILGNEVLRDTELSLKARGLLAMLLSFPPGWRTSSERIAATGPDGRDAIRTALRELEQRGYVVRRKVQDELGRWQTITIVRDTLLANAELPGDDAGDTFTSCPPPATGFPASDNPSPNKGTTKKDVTRLVVRRTKEGQPRVCGRCAGTGWTPDAHDTLTRCHCTGGGV
jgi:hypothetical protein